MELGDGRPFNDLIFERSRAEGYVDVDAGCLVAKQEHAALVSEFERIGGACSKTCAFRLLRSIQSPFAERCAAGGGAGAACEQPRNRTVAAMCQRMGGAVYAPTPAAQTRPAYFFLTGWRAAAGAFPDCLLPSRITT